VACRSSDLAIGTIDPDSDGADVTPDELDDEETGPGPRGIVRLVRSQGRRAIAVDGVVQSVEVPEEASIAGYWPEMLPRRPIGRALVLGMGGGTIAHLILREHPAARVCSVDDDARIIELARRNARFRLDDPRIEIVLGDAFAHVRALVAQGKTFDLIAVDLFRAGEVVRAAFARPFLRRLDALCNAGGVVTFNLIRDRRTARIIRRVAQHLRLIETRLIGLNCVLHCESSGLSGISRERASTPRRARGRLTDR